MKIAMYMARKNPAECWADTHLMMELKESFEKLGHAVSVYDESDRLGLSKGLPAVDLFLADKETFSPVLVPEETTTIYWCHNTDVCPSGYDAYMTARGEHWVKGIEEFFGKPCTKVIFGVNPEKFKPLDWSNQGVVFEKKRDNTTYRWQGVFGKDKYDFVYAGHKLTKDYQRYLRPAMNYKLGLFGAPYCWSLDSEYAFWYKGQVHYDDLPKLYNSTKFVLNFHCAPNKAMDLLTTRVFEAAACGVPQVCDNIPCLRNVPVITVDQEVVGDKYKYMIDSDYGLHSCYGSVSRQWILDNDHTWDARAKQILKYYGKVSRNGAAVGTGAEGC